MEATESKSSSGMSKLVGETLLETELAKALGVSLGTVRRLRHQGKIPYVQIGGAGKVIYMVESIMQWLKRKEIREAEAEPIIGWIEQKKISVSE